ncbi:MAG: hypothetical protein WC907_01010 [Acholeplasmataceae bacterium]|jgi:hypothetical protein
MTQNEFNAECCERLIDPDDRVSCGMAINRLRAAIDLAEKED